MNHNPSFKIYNASAGSGKTYTLVQEFLLILLANSDVNTFSQLLAITFTNKAANEMKHRIIDWLKKFSMPGYETNQDLINIREKLKNDGYHLTLEDIHFRSKKILDYVLHHYSTLNIGTIDKDYLIQVFHLRLLFELYPLVPRHNGRPK